MIVIMLYIFSQIKSNFIAVSKFNYPVVHYYSFEASDLRKKKAGKNDSNIAFEQMKMKKKFGNNVSPVYDGGSVYSEAQLAIGHSKETRSHEVKIPVDADGSGREKNLKVEIKYQGEIDLSPIGEYVRKGSNSPWTGEVQHILTVLITKFDHYFYPWEKRRYFHHQLVIVDLFFCLEVLK